MSNLNSTMGKVAKFVLINKYSLFIIVFLVIHNLLSGNIWFWNLFSVLPPIFFLVIALTAIIWSFAKQNYLMVVILLPIMLLVSNNFDITFKNYTDQPSENSQQIKIFNWNTQFWETDNKDDFYKFLLNQNADVYHLQEHIELKNNSFIELDDLDEVQSRFKGYKVIKKTEFLTITRLPIVESYENTDSYYLRVDVEVKNNILSLYNVHIPVQINPKKIENPIDFLIDLKDRFYWRELEYFKLLQDVKKNINEFYISGDFNTTKSMGKIHSIIDLGKDAIYASNNILNATWGVNNFRLWRIDYNIVHKGLKVLDYKEVNPLNYSDHWAQLVTVQL